MFLRRIAMIVLTLVMIEALNERTIAQVIPDTDAWVDKFNAFFPIDHSRPLTIAELCHRLDCLSEEMRNDGLVVLKQPDVFSQARMTRFRYDFDNQMSTDLNNFHLILSARINRLDSATTTSTTALGAGVSAPGTTNVQTPSSTALFTAASPNPNPGTGSSSLFGPGATFFGGAAGATAPASSFGTLGTANPYGNPSGTPPNLSLGVEPTVYLEEKQRFLQQLNQIRRLNLGPDQNDASGYGLYVVRLPVSIAPGECTYQGHGADIAVHVEHEFTPDFLPSTFQRLVTNDLIDELGPFLYEVIRSGFYDQDLKPRHDARVQAEILKRQLADRLAQHMPINSATPPNPGLLTKFILRLGLPSTGDSDVDQVGRGAMASRLKVLSDTPAPEFDAVIQGTAASSTLAPLVGSLVREFTGNVSTPAGRAALARRVAKLYALALPDDLQHLDDFLQLSSADREQLKAITAPLATANYTLLRPFGKSMTKLNVNLPSVRTPKQFYPIAPREMLDFFLEENIYLLAMDVKEASRFSQIRSSEVRDYLRQIFDPAYFAMSEPSDRSSNSQPPLVSEAFMSAVRDAVRARRFGGKHSELEKLYSDLIEHLKSGRKNIDHKSIAALCWAIAVDAALLDAALLEDARTVFAKNGVPCDTLDGVHLYYPKRYPNEAASTVFREYVRLRWPILTFTIEPVTDQQNIADSFNLKRDLQLALSFAFATGQISFSQLSTFRRQIEQSSDAIALNRTITGFTQGNDNFGFRFTPRFQNPPNQRTNIGVIASQLISGGPGPDYQTRKSKLEPGMRELNAVLLIPTFLPVMRMDVTSNWFKLTDPEHLVFHTKRMLERGRRVQELRRAVVDMVNAHEYRDADLRVLQTKLTQLDGMLPMQTKVIELPFENTASGFDLLCDGATALVPQLTGFSGVDQITAPGNAAVTPPSGSSGSATTPQTQSFSVTPLTTNQPSTNQVPLLSYTLAGGTTSIADVFVFGKYISLLDTRVIAGGRIASFEPLSREVVHVQVPANIIPTTTEDGNQYVEIYLATPNGISNSVLIPYVAAAATAKPGFDVNSKSQSYDLYYQWLPGAGGTNNLAATSTPNDVMISWNSPTSLAPKQIQVQFVATIGTQTVSFIMQSKPNTSGDYAIDGGQFSVTLLNLVQGLAAYPAVPPASIPLTVNVQPFLPTDPQGLRVQPTPQTLNSKVTVNMHYSATGTNALPTVAPIVPLPPAPAAAGGGGKTTSLNMVPRRASGQELSVRVEKDPSLVRTAQQLPPLPTSLTIPQPPNGLEVPTLLGPNVSSEAEQITKLLTGQPIATTLNPSSQILPTGLPTNPGSAISNAVASASSLTTTQIPQIVVMPAPVTVISPPPASTKKKHTSRFHAAINRISNRVSEAIPGR